MPLGKGVHAIDIIKQFPTAHGLRTDMRRMASHVRYPDTASPSHTRATATAPPASLDRGLGLGIGLALRRKRGAVLCIIRLVREGGELKGLGVRQSLGVSCYLLFRLRWFEGVAHRAAGERHSLV